MTIMGGSRDSSVTVAKSLHPNYQGFYQTTCPSHYSIAVKSNHHHGNSYGRKHLNHVICWRNMGL